MADKDPKDQPLEVEEDADGSATVQLPEGFVPPPENAEEGVNVETQGVQQDTDDADQPNDTEAVRAARRARRRAKKDLARHTSHEKDTRLELLQRQNRELQDRLSRVEQRTVQSDMMQLDKNIEDAQVRFEYAKMQLAEATTAGDGAGVAEAQSAWYEAREQLGRMHQGRQQIARQQENQRQAPADMDVQRNATAWSERNKWFDPTGRDPDSRVAKTIDAALAEEGLSPRTPEYWDELDNRLQKYLPHRYTGAANGGSSTGNQRPRNVVGSSGREASAAFGGDNRGTFTLSPERVRAMKDAGAWDNPERRQVMIQKYVAYDRTHRS